MQVWQTPVRQAQRAGMSQASASSSTLRRPAGNRVVMPLRVKVTSGPVPGSPGGWCGARLACLMRPGLMAGRAPNSSVWMRAGSIPAAVRAPVMSVMNEAGPQTWAVAVAGMDSAMSLSLVSRPGAAFSPRRWVGVAAL